MLSNEPLMKRKSYEIELKEGPNHILSNGQLMRKKCKKDQTERKRLSRNKRKLENPVKLSQMELLAQIKKKKTLG